MSKTLTKLVNSSMILALLAGCGAPNLNAIESTAASLKTAATSKNTTKATSSAPVKASKIALKPLAKTDADTMQQQLKQAAKQAPATNATEVDQDEIDKIKALIKEVESKIQEEDQEFEASAKPKSFAVKSAQQGKDVEIDLFLMHPKYARKSKFWGIKNANEFLQAGRSPTRRWLLKMKLEGLFAPNWFEQQLLFWVEQADLLRITNVNRDQAFLMVAHGITSAPDLARRNVIELAALMVSMKIMAFQYGMKAPSLDELEGWAKEARTLEPVIY